MQKRFFLRAPRFVRVRLRTPTKQTTYQNRWEKSRKSAIKLLRTMGLCDIIKMSWLAPCLICKSGGKRYGKYSHGSELPYNTPVSSDHAASRSKDVQDIFERRNPLKSKGFRMGEDKYEIRYRRRFTWFYISMLLHICEYSLILACFSDNQPYYNFIYLHTIPRRNGVKMV